MLVWHVAGAVLLPRVWLLGGGVGYGDSAVWWFSMLAQSDFTLTRAGMLGWSLASLCLGFPSVKWGREGNSSPPGGLGR